MAKQKCGSCQFFQEAGLAGSGWCHHPQRKVSSGVLIMVRRNELACRDEWSRSLWQPVAAPKTNGALPFERPLSAGPLLPMQPENLRSLLRPGADASGMSEGEDVLLSEGRIVSEAHKPWESSERPLSTANFDPRTAIFRAREAYRERARAKAVADRQSGGAEAATTEKPQQHSAQPKPEELATGVSELEAHDGETGFVVRGTPDQALETDSALAGPARNERLKQNHESLPIIGLPERRLDASGGAQVVDSNGDGDATETRPVTLPVVEPSVVPVAADKSPDDRVTATRRPAGSEGEPDEEPLPSWFRTDLPRICRSCRDFRPASDGQRGWCANAWAFTHRRLVQEDDVAPCRSAIGDWWTPVDDVWLVAADVSSHGRATPLLDRLTGKVHLQRRRS